MKIDDPTTWPELMKPDEVARVFRVDPKTVNRWSAAGGLPSIKTPGGHRRYARETVLGVLQTQAQEEEL